MIRQLKNTKSNQTTIIPIFLIAITLALTLTHFPVTPTNQASAQSTPTIYIDCTAGNDSSDGTTPETAWQTLTRLQSYTLTPGTTTYFKSGCSFDTATSYPSIPEAGLYLDESGTSGSPITLTSYGTGAKPAFYNSTANTLSKSIQLIGSYFVLQNLSISNTSEYAVLVDGTSDHNILQNLTITNSGTGVVFRGNHNQLLDSTISDLKMIQNTNDGGDNDYGATAVVITGSNNEIAHNTIDNAISPSFDYGVDGGAFELFGYDSYTTVSNNSFHHNTVTNSDGIIEIGSTNNATFANNTIAFNLFVNNGKLITAHLSGNWTGNLTGTKFFNNTVVDDSTQYTITSGRTPTTLFQFSDPGPDTNTLEVFNNIFDIKNASKIANYNTFDHHHNLWNLTNTPLGNYQPIGSEILQDPLFANPGQNDYTLTSSSPAINSGTNQALYSTDLNGSPTPLDAQDLGAYELQSAQTTCLKADINQDGTIDQADRSILIQDFFTNTNRSDLNSDNLVDLTDYSLLAQNYNQSSGCQP